MQHLRKIPALVLPLILAGILYSCANIVKPNGGPRDKKGPQVIGVIPAPKTLQFTYEKVDVYFDEYLKPGNYRDAVFISPVPDNPPTITVKNKRLRIVLNDTLRDSTTYVITLGSEIKDFNEGNKMEKPFIYAFSTGNQLDSLTIKGRVTNPWTAKGQPGMKIFLFPEEDIEGNEIKEKRPVYATETDPDGNFTFQYLRSARFKVYGVADKDNNYMYNLASEAIALVDSPIVNMTDSLGRARFLDMYSFVVDKEAPTVKSVKWVNDYTLHVEFGEGIRDTFGTETLSMFLSDTLGEGGDTIRKFRYRYKNKRHFYVSSPLPRDKDLDMRFNKVMDTLGQYADTTLRVFMDLFDKKDKGRLYDTPIVMPGTNRIHLESFFVLPEELDTSQVALKDTAGKYMPLSISTKDFVMHIDPDSVPDHKIEYKLELRGTIAYPDGKATDTLIEFPIRFIDPSTLGSLSGEIMPDTLDSTMQIVMLLMGQQGKKVNVLHRVKGPGKFEFKHLPAGKYTIKMIRDKDGNGYLSPGSLDPYFLPETSVNDSKPVTVKASWDTEGYNVFPYQKKSSKLDKLNTEGKEEEEKPEEED